MAAYTLGGGRSTLANQGYIPRHGGHASRILSNTPTRGRAETVEGSVAIRYSADSHSTREIIQFFSICFIENRPKAKQIKWVKSDPVSVAFFLEITTTWWSLTWFRERERNVIERERQPSGANGTSGASARSAIFVTQVPSNKVSRINGPKWLNLH